MHCFLDENDPFWEQEMWRDDSDTIQQKLLDYAKKTGVPEENIKDEFKEYFSNQSNMHGCVVLRYTNKIAKDKYHVSILLSEQEHNFFAEVEVIAYNKITNKSEYQREVFFSRAGEDCKGIAAKFVQLKAKELEQILQT